MKKSAHQIALLLLLVIAVYGESMAAGKGHSQINCSIHDGPCIQVVNGHQVTFEVLPRPVKAMQDLIFMVTIDGDYTPNKPPHIDLNMPAMNMGRNRVSLKLNEKDVYEGSGVIVRCKSGHRIWRATVNLPGMGNVDFIFDVIY
jgi:hypothetical protein